MARPKEKTASAPTRPSLLLSICIFIVVVSILILGLLVFQADVHILLFLCILAACLFGLLLKNPWKNLESAMRGPFTGLCRRCCSSSSSA